ncbi:MAG: mechanosensitive ion channel domain-containing protein [Patescibacteria group bacterium]
MAVTSFSDRIFELLAKSWDRLPQLLLTIVVGYIIIKLIKAFLRGLIGYSKANSALKGIVLSVLDVALWIFLIAALLQQVGLTQISLALSGTVAISALALSAGSTAFIQDLVAGIFLAQDPDFSAGDRVKVDEVEGIVERMDARKIRLRDDKGILHIFPNSHFDRTAWMVLKKR